MASVVVNGDTSGAVTLSAPAVAGTVTVTLPAASGTMLTTASTAVITQAMLSTNVSGNGPAFSAYFSGNPNLSANTATKIAYNTEVFDTNSNFDTTNNRFTPTVAGYYLVTLFAKIYTATNQTSFTKGIYIYKNGSNYKEVSFDGNFAYANNNHTLSVTSLVYCNGTSDYIEGYVLIGVAGNLIGGAPNANTFEAFLVRAA
jgi:hypothetical protein